MGYPFFSYWNHTISSGRTDLVLTEDLSDLQVTPIRDASDGVTLRGNYRRATGRPSVRVRIVLERFTSRELFRKFSAMINHLERGGWVSFGLDDAKAYGALLIRDQTQGDRAIYVGENIYTGYTPGSASTTILAGSTSAPYGDEFIIESPPPIAAREYFAVYSTTVVSPGHLIRLDASGGGTTGWFIGEDYPSGSLVRHSDFWPKLFLPAGSIGSSLLTHNHRIAYTLDLPLEYVIPNKTYVEDQPDEPEGTDDPNNDTPGPQDSADGGVATDGAEATDEGWSVTSEPYAGIPKDSEHGYGFEDYDGDIPDGTVSGDDSELIPE